MRFCLLLMVVLFATACTENDTFVPPVISLYAAANQTDTSCEFYGALERVGSSPVLQKGFCWSTFSPPTVSNLSSQNGSEVGTYNFTATNLNSQTEYFVRAYVRTENGVYYSHIESFTTD